MKSIRTIIFKLSSLLWAFLFSTMLCYGQGGTSNPSYIEVLDYIDIMLDSYRFTTKTGQPMSMYSVSGLNAVGIRRTFTNANALANSEERFKSYKRVLRRVAFQSEFLETNQTEFVRNTECVDNNIISLITELSKYKGAVFAAKLVNALELLKIDVPARSTGQVMTDYKLTVNLHKGLAAAQSQQFKNLNGALGAISVILNTLSIISDAHYVYMNAMLLDALAFDVGLQRLERLKNQELIQGFNLNNDREFERALNAVIKEFSSKPDNFYDQLKTSFLLNPDKITDGIFSFIKASNGILGLVGYYKSIPVFSGISGWATPVIFAVEVVNDANYLKDLLLDAASAATLYKFFKMSKTMGSKDFRDIDLTIIEYSQYEFINTMNRIFDFYHNEWYLKILEWMNPSQRVNRDFFKETLADLAFKIELRRIQDLLLLNNPNIVIDVDNSEIEIKIWDDEIEDGDIISVLINDEPVMDRFTVTKSGERFRLKLSKGDNILAIRAENLGSIPPNTAGVAVFCNNMLVKEFIFKSNAGTIVNYKIRCVCLDIK